MLVSGIPALRLFGDPRCTIVPMVRLFLNVAALLIMNVLIAPYDCIRNPCMLLGGESSEPSAHARKSLCSGRALYYQYAIIQLTLQHIIIDTVEFEYRMVPS